MHPRPVFRPCPPRPSRRPLAGAAFFFLKPPGGLSSRRSIDRRAQAAGLTLSSSSSPLPSSYPFLSPACAVHRSPFRLLSTAALCCFFYSTGLSCLALAPLRLLRLGRFRHPRSFSVCDPCAFLSLPSAAETAHCRRTCNALSIYPPSSFLLRLALHLSLSQPLVSFALLPSFPSSLFLSPFFQAHLSESSLQGRRPAWRAR